MADSKEQLKRKNYFDLKRDEFMAMDEYLQSPISEIDLKKNESWWCYGYRYNDTTSWIT